MGNNKSIREYIADSNLSETARNAVIDWVVYRRRYGQKFTAGEINELLSQAEKAESEYGAGEVEKFINISIGDEYRELCWDRLTRIARLGAREMSVSRETYEYTKHVYKLVSGKEWSGGN